MNLKDWQKKLRADRLTPRTISFYCESIHAIASIFAANGRSIDPREVTPETVAWFLDFMAAEGYAVQTRKGYLTALRRWCRDGGNRKVDRWPKSRLPHDMRPTVAWLNATQVSQLLACDMSPLQELVVNLELRQGLRRVEVIRLSLGDCDMTAHTLTASGKGPKGGKPRKIPMVPQTEHAIKRWLEVRDSLVTASRARFPRTFSDPGNLIIYEKSGRLFAYSEEGYGLDKMVILPLSTKLHYKITNHMLRRTFGRALYRSGVEVATISRILGHESTEVTLRYIGIDLDDMRAAMGRDIFGGI